jgi:hypothetical protein
MCERTGYEVGPCFGHPSADPATCKHPLSAQHCTILDEPRLMIGGRVAGDDEQPTSASVWAPVDKRRGKAGEYWYTTVAVSLVRCFACGQVVSEGVIQQYIEELPPAVLAERWHIPLADAERCHRPTKRKEVAHA